MADISSLVQESLSVSGHPARQVDGPQRRARRPLRARVREPRRARGPVAHGRALDDGDDPDLVRGHARARLPVRRPRRRRRLDRHRRRLHHPADAHLLPIQSLLSVGVDIQSSSALFERVFEYLDMPVDIHPGDARRSTHPRGDVQRSTTSGSATPATTTGPSPASTSTSRPARGRRSSARPARARRRSATSSRGSTTPTDGAIRIDGADVRELPSARSPTRSASCRRRPTSSTPRCARTCASRGRTRPTRRSRRRPAPPRSTT